MLERLDNCPICNNENYEKILISRDFVVTDEKFEVVACSKCNFKFTNPRPSENLIGKYYQSNNYISHQDESKGLINKVYFLVKKIALQNKLKLINSIQTNGTLLDIGCGTGSFLDVCQKNNWNVKGIEPDENARKKASLKINTKIYPDVFSYSEKEKIDIITMWHVVEHIHQLDKSLTKIENLLDQNGKLVIAVPNVNSWDAKLYKEFWAAYDLPRHLYHFSKESLTQLLRKYQFKLTKIEPMKFDSYYISLLSNKYRDRKMNYWEALKNGYLSNEWAKKNDNNYSSLTYIFSK